MNDFNYDNEIIEVSDETSTETLEDLIKKEAEGTNNENLKKNKKNKKSLKDKLNDLSKKQKTIIIVVSFLVLVLIIGLVIFFVTHDKKEEPKKPEEPTVVIEKDNYRYENGKLVFLDKNEKEIGSYECTNKDSEKCYVTKISYENDEFERIKNVYENGDELVSVSKIYNDTYVFVTDDDIIYLYNMKSNEKELELVSIKTYSTERDLVVLEDENNLYGLIEITNEGFEYLIRCSYNNLGIINTKELLLIAEDKDKHYIIDSEGKTLSKNILVTVKSADSNYIVGEENNSYSLYNYEYEELLSDYDYISLHDGVISLINNKRLYLVDNELNKLYEDGVRLESNDYIKKYVYTSDNRLKETLKSYEIEIKDSKVNIIIGKDTTEVNLLEGKLSGNLSYMSYFDGKLYFYGDEDKADMIGTYICNNINNITTIDNGLTNCNLYTNESGISGIYNNEYVIINDSNDTINKVYYLYSLKEKKVKGTYSEINIVNSSEVNASIKPIYTSSSFIIAKSATGSNKGNYGVLEINSDKVQGKVGFKYESIVLEKDIYKLVSVDKTYSLYDSKFNKISNEFSYIELFDDYYVGINNNKLNVFTYTSQMEILEEGINITGTEFKIDFTNGFSITINDTKYDYDKTGKKIVKPEISTPSEEEEEEGDTNGE